MGELHLDIKVDILKRTYSVELDVGQPQVVYRETITMPIEDSYAQETVRRIGSVWQDRLSYSPW